MTPAVLQAAAVALDLPSALSTATTPRALAARLGLVEHRLAWLLRALARSGTLTRAAAGGEETYRLASAPPRASAPVRGSGLLATLLRRPEPLAWIEAAGNPDAAALTTAEALTAPEVAAAEVAALLAPPLAAGGLFLDAGGGGGAYTEAVLAAAPSAAAVVCDLPIVLPLAARRLSGRGLRVAFLAGDLRTAVLPRSHAILASQVLHLLSADDARLVVTRLAAALEPGGRLVIKEVALDDDGGGPDLAVRFALSLTLHGPGTLHTAATIEGWLRDAGLRVSARTPLASAPEALAVIAESTAAAHDAAPA